MADGVSGAPPQPVFYYDLGNVHCYLVAEQISSTLPVVAEWEPVWEPAIGEAPAELDREQVGELAAEIGLLPLRWPQRWPPDSEMAMRAATYAKRVGRTIGYSLAAFRQVFAGGRDLGEEDTVLIAAAACEMHPTAMLKGIRLRSIEQALGDATARARAAGVVSLPAIQVGDEVFEGGEALAAAAASLGR